MIDHDAGPPPWMQLAAILRGRIARREITGRLPSEKTLSQEYGIALTTVRKAVAALRAEGLIVTEHGWGSRVVTPADSGAPPPGAGSGAPGGAGNGGQGS